MRQRLSLIAVITVLLLAYNANAAVVTNGLVSWWKLDEGTGNAIYDTAPAGNNNTGSTYNAPAWTTDTPGAASTSALDFNGSNQYGRISTGSTTTLAIADAITVEAWVKTDTLTSSWPAFVSRQESTAYSWVLGYDNASKMRFRVWTVDGGGTKYEAQVSTTDIPSTGEWFHIVGTFDSSLASGQIKLYINNSLKASTTLTGTIRTDQAAVFIGRMGASYHDGLIDDVRVYDRALSLSEVGQNYAAIPEPATMLLLAGGLLGFTFRRARRKPDSSR